MRRSIFPGFMLVLLISSFALAQVTQQLLYETLLKTTPQNVPPQFSGPHTKTLPISQGMAGALEIDFANDANARASIFVFTNNDAAATYNRTVLPAWSKDQKLLPYPPMARCMSNGSCDLWLQSDNVILKTTAASQDAAAALMGMLFKHFYYVKEHIQAQPPQKQQGPCSLLTKSEVETYVGPIREPEPDRTGGCFYGTNSGDGVTIQVPGTGKSGFDQAKRRSQKASTMQGVGDDAFAFVSLAGFVQVDFIKNNQYVTMIYQNQRDHSPLNAARDLAAKIAARL